MGEEHTEATPRAARQADETPAALRVIAAFGGIRPMAGKLGVPVSTVQGWKERTVIPEVRHAEVRAAAEAHGVALSETDLAASAETPAETPGGEAPREALRPAQPRRAAEPPTSEGEAPKPGRVPRRPEAAQTKPEGAARRPEAPPAAPPPPAAAPAAPAAWGRVLIAFVAGAAVLTIGALGAVLTRDLWAPAPEAAGADPAARERLASLEARLAELEARPAPQPALPDDLVREGELARLSETVRSLDSRLASLDSRAAAVGGLDQDLAEVRARLDEVQARFDSLDQETEALDARIAAVQSEIAAVQTDQESARAVAAQEAALWAALGRLRDALRYAGPFAAELDDVRRLAGDAPEVRAALAPLDPLAADGAPTLAELRERFEAAARDIVAAGYEDSHEGVLGDVLRRVTEVVSVRPVGDVPGEAPAAVVARAEAHLERGDLRAAVSELDALSGEAAEAAAPWRAQAGLRLEADAAISTLNTLLARRASAGG